MEPFGYFGWREFDPETWKNEYPNPAFSRATERDNAWMARILSRFDPDDVRALVDLGKFHRAEHAEYLADVLERRRSSFWHGTGRLSRSATSKSHFGKPGTGSRALARSSMTLSLWPEGRGRNGGGAPVEAGQKARFAPAALI
jgi:hypothetical protein